LARHNITKIDSICPYIRHVGGWQLSIVIMPVNWGSNPFPLHLFII
jgi:hypothetical protein